MSSLRGQAALAIGAAFVMTQIIVLSTWATQHWSIPRCAATACNGLRVASDMGFLRFCVPGSIRVRVEYGEHGDKHYTLTTGVRGEKYDLYFVSGPYFSGRDPSAGDLGWTIRQWSCAAWKGEEYRTASGGRRTRYLALNAIMGYAQYRDVPAEAAIRFDRILDSLSAAEIAWLVMNQGGECGNRAPSAGAPGSAETI